MITCKFKFAPYDFVKVNHLGLVYEGRVQECLWGGEGEFCYIVEYAADGAFRTDRFNNDELEAVE